jgi:hypothetical protein
MCAAGLYGCEDAAHTTGITNVLVSNIVFRVLSLLLGWLLVDANTELFDAGNSVSGLMSFAQEWSVKLQN